MRDDNVIYNLCNSEGIKVYRGSAFDLLDRHYKAAIKYNADVVIKIPSDCPLISPKVIDQVISFYLDATDYDYVSNLHPPTYPDGNDIEVMSFRTIEKAWKEAIQIFEREHTTPYIWDNPDLFRVGNVTWETGLDYSISHRWTIDYPEDYIFIKNIYERLVCDFELEDILNLLNKEPELVQINSKYNGVNWYRNYPDKLKTIHNLNKRKPKNEKIY